MIGYKNLSDIMDLPGGSTSEVEPFFGFVGVSGFYIIAK